MSNAAVGLVLLVGGVLVLSVLASVATSVWTVLWLGRPQRMRPQPAQPYRRVAQRPTLWGPEHDEPTRPLWRDPDQTQQIVVGGEPT